MGVIEFASPESASYVRSLNESTPIFPNQGTVIDFFEPRPDATKPAYGHYPLTMSHGTSPPVAPPSMANVARPMYSEYSKTPTQMTPMNQFSAPVFYPGDMSYQSMLAPNAASFLDYYTYQLGRFSRSTNASSVSQSRKNEAFPPSN